MLEDDARRTCRTKLHGVHPTGGADDVVAILFWVLLMKD